MSEPRDEPATLYDVERELDRMVDRLMSMPLARVETAAPDVHAAAEALLAQSRRLDPLVPATAEVPTLEPQGLGPLIAVLGRDWLAAARSAADPDADTVLGILVTLRRSLP